MKIIHTADWHLGQTFYSHDRVKEHEVFLDWLCAVIKERGTDLLLIAGDVFDTQNPSAEAQKLFYAFLSKVTSQIPGLQIIITAGNHDSAARLEAPSPMLKQFNISVSGVVHYTDGEIDYDRMIVPLDKGGCCLAVPFLRHNDYPAAESYSEGVAKLYSELYDRACQKGFSPIIAMGHLQASGAEVSVGDSSEYATIGGMEGLDASFANDGIAYTALGHLHKAQRVARKENVRYSGSPLPMSFAERKNRQSVTEVTLDGESFTYELLYFDAPVKLLTVPPTPLPVAEVVEALSALPDGEVESTSPFLEVRILVTTVDPTLRQQIEDALTGKAVRLARIESTAEGTAEEIQATRPMTFDDFKKKAPKELIQEIYTRECSEEMPVHLMNLLDEVIKTLENEDIGNQR
jgi:exonuclease SbcD